MKKSDKPEKPKCGLCGNNKNLMKTECCDNWVCDDEHEYKLFSFARNSCARNHRRYTLCGYHHGEEHSGNWQDCKKCREDFESEMVCYFGTNEYNFEKLKNPPSYEPTRCCECSKILKLGEDSYTGGSDGKYWCTKCKPIPIF